MTAILPKELLTATLGGLSLLVVSGGSDGDVLVQQSDGTYAPETLVTGDVFGPASSTDNAIARFDATTGKLLQNCVVTIGDTGNIAGLGTVSCGAITASGLINLQNGTTPQRLTLHSTYTSSTSFANLDVRANAGGTAYEISSFKGSAGGANLPINIGHRDAAGTFTKYLEVGTSGVQSLQVSLGSLLLNDPYGVNFARFCTGTAANFVMTALGEIGFWSTLISAGGSIDTSLTRHATGPMLQVKANGGLRVRNYANSADASLTCGAITASGFSTVAQTGASGTSIAASGLVTTTFNTSLVSQGQAWVGTDGTTYWTVGSLLQSGNQLIQLDATMAGSNQGRLNLGAGYLHVEGGPSSTGLRSFGNLTLSPAALGGSGSVVVNGAITASGLVCMSIYTVATLPSASANAYKEANVSDALAPAMGVAVVGGGSVKTKVRSNGTDWTVCGI